jgi:uncharacterized radical SAM superfamily protein
MHDDRFEHGSVHSDHHPLEALGFHLRSKEVFGNGYRWVYDLDHEHLDHVIVSIEKRGHRFMIMVTGIDDHGGRVPMWQDMAQDASISERGWEAICARTGTTGRISFHEKIKSAKKTAVGL